MAIERQKTWSGLVIMDMFLGGTGAGLFAVSFILIILNHMVKAAQLGLLMGPLLMIIGLFFLLLELGTPRNAFRILTGFGSSWMSRGALLQGLFILCALIYSVPGLWLPWWYQSEGIMGIVSFTLSILCSAYYGIFLSKSKGIALWSSPVWPLASFVISLCCGIGVTLILMMGFLNVYPANEVLATSRIIGLTGLGFIIFALILIWALLSSNSGVTYNQSIQAMGKTFLLTAILLAAGLILLALSLWVNNQTTLSALLIVSGILLLVSGYWLRSAIIKSGYFYSMHIPIA